MRVIVFGATGRVGQQVVEHLLRDGHRVAVYVRNVVKIPITWSSSNVKVFIGSMGDKIKISKAIESFDVVISTLGNSPDSKSDVGLEEGTRNIIDAMRTHNTLRFIGVAPSDLPDPVESKGAIRNFSRTCCFLRTPRFKALEAACRLVMHEESFMWTFVRFRELLDSSSFRNSKRLEGFYDFSDKQTASATVADVSAFIAAHVASDSPFIRRCPGVATVQSLGPPSATSQSAPPSSLRPEGLTGFKLVALQPAVQPK